AFEVGETPAEGLAVLGDRARHVHLKDVARDPGEARGWAPRLPGGGEFGPGEVLALLRASGYDRWVSFEWEKRWHPALAEPEAALPYFLRWAAATLRGLAPAPEAVAGPPASPVRTLQRGRLEVEVHA